MTEALVSVLIPAYNHEKYVQETIKSIIAQTYQNIELIVIDDGSKDSTWQKIQEMESECEKRFVRVVFETKENEGTSKTLNKLIESAKGEYVYLIASDDMAKPEAIETHIKFLNKHKDYILCVGNCELIDSDGKSCYWNKNLELIYEKEKAKYKDFGSRLKYSRKDVNFNSSYFGTYPSLVKGNYIPNGYLVRKSVYEKTGLYTNEAPLEDYYMNLQLSKFGKMKYLEKVLFSYRWHDTNTIKNIDKMRKWTKITQDYDQSLLTNSEWLDKHYKDLLPEVKDYIHYGVIYKKFGLKNVFEFQKFKKDDTITKIIKIVTVPFLVISKGNKKTSVKFFHK